MYAEVGPGEPRSSSSQPQSKGSEAERGLLSSPLPHPPALELSKQEEIFNGRFQLQ